MLVLRQSEILGDRETWIQILPELIELQRTVAGFELNCLPKLGSGFAASPLGGGSAGEPGGRAVAMARIAERRQADADHRHEEEDHKHIADEAAAAEPCQYGKGQHAYA